MTLLDKLQHLAFDDLARTEAGSAILLVSESEYAELREFAAHTCTVTLTGPQILDLYEACGGEFTELTSWTVGEREAFVTDDGEQMPAGLYATCTEYPEEGFLGPLGVGSEADSAGRHNPHQGLCDWANGLTDDSPFRTADSAEIAPRIDCTRCDGTGIYTERDPSGREVERNCECAADSATHWEADAP